MTITEVSVSLPHNENGKVICFASVVFDHCLALHDIKLIRRLDGTVLMSMPSRRMMGHCAHCDHLNPYGAKFCHECGKTFIPRNPPHTNHLGRPVLYTDVAHPITPEYRLEILRAIQEEYVHEQRRAEQSGYVRRHDYTKLHDEGEQ